MATPVQTAQVIRFTIDSLGDDNGHHTFEQVCRHVAVRRIASNVLPASGPVSAYGDQGRDFETFRTFLAEGIPYTSGFLALTSSQTIAFACTIQKEALKLKLEADLQAICGQGSNVDRVVFFVGSAVPIGLRHHLEELAGETYQVAVTIIDRSALADLLAHPDLYWIAQQYLHLPSELAPRESLSTGSDAARGPVINPNTNVHVGGAYHVYGVEAMPLAAAELDFSTVLADATVHRFIGRKWLYRQIEDSLATVDDSTGLGCYVLVGAQAGMGKTAFAAWLSQRWACASHFVTQRIPGSEQPGVALRSLAAQMIRRYRLADEFAPTGMLPAWAGDPAHFPTVLAAAASHARDAGEVLKIVVDGLDEADGDGPALGLPHLLPAGVQVIATYRNGIPPGRLPYGDTVRTVCIEANDPENHKDIAQFLADRVQDEVVADRLSAADVSAERFVSVVSERCGGVWVYLRYVLSEIRICPWKMADLDKLPAGLADYYYQYIIERRNQPEFFEQDLPLMAMLATVRQPVTADQLGRVTGLTPTSIRELCNHRYRPFLSIDVRDEVVRYSIYHSSLRDFLSGHPLRQSEISGFDPVARRELREATQVAQHRINDYYLEIFGGLFGGLKSLRTQPAISGSDDYYALRHLPAHLIKAGRHQDLYNLFTCRNSEPGSPLGTIWADAHDWAGSLDEYSVGLDIVRSITEQCTDAAVAAGKSAPTLGLETQFALLAATLVSRSNAIPLGLLVALVQTGEWAVARALSHAFRLHDPTDRANALIALAPHATELAQRACHGALIAIAGIRDEWSRAEALAKLAPHLRAEQHNQALEVATGIEDEWAQALGLAAMAPCLDSEGHFWAIKRTMEIISKVAGSAWERIWVLATVAPHLNSEDRARVLGQALEAIPTISMEENWPPVLERVAPQLSPGQLARALKIVSEIEFAGTRAWALATLLPYLDPAARARELDLAVRDLNINWREETRAYALRYLVPYFVDSADRAQALDDALRCVLEESDIASRAVGLACLAPYLSLAKRVQVLDDEMEILSRTGDEEALDELAPHLDCRQLKVALEAISGIRDEGMRGVRAQTMAALAPYLGVGQLREALKAAANIEDEWLLEETLTGLAPHLASRNCIRAFDQMLEIIVESVKPKNEWVLARMLSALAPHLSVVQLNRALGIAEGIADAQSRAKAFTGLVSSLKPADRARVIRQALVAIFDIEDDVLRVRPIVALAPHLETIERAQLLDQALHAVPKIKNGWSQACALAELAPHLAVGDCIRAFDQMLEIIVESVKPKSEWTLARMLSALAPHLSVVQLNRALGIAEEIVEVEPRIMALVGLLPCLKPADRARVTCQALLAIFDIEDDVLRVRPIIALMPYLETMERVQLLDQALRAIPKIGYNPTDALADLIKYLNPLQLNYALDLVQDMTNEIGYKKVYVQASNRITVLVNELSPEKMVPLIRRIYYVPPPRSLLLRSIGELAEATVRISGRDAIEFQFNAISHEIIAK